MGSWYAACLFELLRLTILAAVSECDEVRGERKRATSSKIQPRSGSTCNHSHLLRDKSSPIVCLRIGVRLAPFIVAPRTDTLPHEVSVSRGMTNVNLEGNAMQDKTSNNGEVTDTEGSEQKKTWRIWCRKTRHNGARAAASSRRSTGALVEREKGNDRTTRRRVKCEGC